MLARGWDKKGLRREQGVKSRDCGMEQRRASVSFRLEWEDLSGMVDLLMDGRTCCRAKRARKHPIRFSAGLPIKQPWSRGWWNRGLGSTDLILFRDQDERTNDQKQSMAP